MNTLTLTSKKEDLRVYNPLWEEHPKVKKIRAESEARGEIRSARRMVVNLVEVRFPNLTELAQQEVGRINDPGVLDLLMQKMATAPDESLVRWLLSSPAA